MSGLLVTSEWLIGRKRCVLELVLIVTGATTVKSYDVARALVCVMQLGDEIRPGIDGKSYCMNDW